MNKWERVESSLISDKDIDSIWVNRSTTDMYVEIHLKCNSNKICLDGQDLQKLLDMLVKPSETL